MQSSNVTPNSVLASTKDIFRTPSLTLSWDKEEAAHKSLQNRTLDYEYPLLSRPIYDLASFRQSNISDQTPNITRSIDWSEDGSSLVTINADFAARLYVLPPDLLEGSNNQLVPFSRVFQPSSILSHCVHPNQSVFCDEGINNTVLLSLKGLPLRLSNLLHSDSHPGTPKTIAYYKFEDLNNSTYNNIYAITYINEYAFAVGGHNSIAYFDLSRSEPVLASKIVNTGIVSTVTRSKSQFLGNSCIYLGSFANQVAVFDRNSNSIVSKTRLEPKNLPADNVGTGVTQVIESFNGHYLYSFSRNAQNINVLDIRMNLKHVASLNGWLDRKTNQRIQADALPDAKGIISGSTNGVINYWKESENGMDCDAHILLDTGTKRVIPAVKYQESNTSKMLSFSYGERPVDPGNEYDCGLCIVSLDGSLL